MSLAGIEQLRKRDDMKLGPLSDNICLDRGASAHPNTWRDATGQLPMSLDTDAPSYDPSEVIRDGGHASFSVYADAPTPCNPSDEVYGDIAYFRSLAEESCYPARVAYILLLGIPVVVGILAMAAGAPLAGYAVCALAAAFVYLEDKGSRPSITNNPGTG